MNEYNDIISLLKEAIPFAFVRFNDGEMMGINKLGSVVARGDQTVSKTLQLKLIEAITHRQENYWIGKPCGKCFKDLRLLYDSYVEKVYKYQTHAVVIGNNGNLNKFIANCNEILTNRNVVWVSGKDQNLDNLSFKDSIYKHITVPKKNAWEKYYEICDYYENFNSGDVVILSCGPMSRVLAYEWFKKRSDCTFLDLGSTYDPYTKNLFHNYHLGKTQFCRECNFNMRKGND